MKSHLKHQEKGTASSPRVVLITGASRGLGRAMALRFSRGGCIIAVNYFQSKDAALETVRSIMESGGEADSFYGDVRSSQDVTSMIKLVYERWGSIDVLINNAAITRDHVLPKIKIGDWEETIATNLTGAFNTIRAVAKFMAKKGGGHIVNISSWSGIKGKSGQASYAASKAGLIGLTKSAALELGRFHVKVNAILPGFMKTDMSRNLPESLQDETVSSNILGSAQDIDEVAEFVYNLSWMDHTSGQVFNLDSRVV